MKACHHAQVPGHLPYCTMALKERCKQEPCQAEKIFAFGPYFQGDATLCCSAAYPKRHGLPAAPCTKKVQPCLVTAQAGCWIDGTKLDAAAKKTTKMTQNTSSEGVLTLAEVATQQKNPNS